MRPRNINRMPLRTQFALVAHLYKLELIELIQLAGRWFTEVAMAAARIVCEVSCYYEEHRHVPKHR